MLRDFLFPLLLVALTIGLLLVLGVLSVGSSMLIALAIGLIVAGAASLLSKKGHPIAGIAFIVLGFVTFALANVLPAFSIADAMSIAGGH